MESESSSGTDQEGALAGWPVGWQALLFTGLVTVILGLIVTILPTQSLTVIAVLLGILLIISGIYHLVHAFDDRDQQRLWHGIVALLFLVVGVVLIRHLQLSLAIIGLIIGFTWIVQGVSVLFANFARQHRQRSGWLVFFGVVSLIAGIVVISAPISSVTALAILVGIWFIVMGVLETVSALMLRRAARA